MDLAIKTNDTINECVVGRVVKSDIGAGETTLLIL